MFVRNVGKCVPDCKLRHCLDESSQPHLHVLLKIHFNIILPSICSRRKCSRLKYVRKYTLPLVQYVSVYDAS